MPLRIRHDEEPINEILRRERFVHVTGLPVKGGSGSPRILRPDPKENGTYNVVNGVASIQCPCGEMWAAYREDVPEELIKQLCPHGKSGIKFFSAGDQIDTRGLLARAGDSYYGIRDGVYDRNCEWSPFPNPLPSTHNSAA